MRQVELNHVYRHFKGNFYYVKDIATSSETDEEFVVYQALYGDSKVYVRPLAMFLEDIDENRADNVTKQKYRFVLVNFNKENENDRY